MLNLRSLRAMLNACDLDDNRAARCVKIAEKATRIERNLPQSYQSDPDWCAEIAKLERLRGEIAAREGRRETAIAFLRENAEMVADLFGDALAPERRAGVVERLQAADLSTIGDTLRTIDRVLRDRAPEKPARPTRDVVAALARAFVEAPTPETLRALAQASEDAGIPIGWGSTAALPTSRILRALDALPGATVDLARGVERFAIRVTRGRSRYVFLASGSHPDRTHKGGPMDWRDAVEAPWGSWIDLGAV